jgi:hypothetical protein
VPPSHILDGFGVFTPPPPSARPVPAGFTGRATPDHPPGFYGPPEGLLAVNTLAPTDQLAPLDITALNARVDWPWFIASQIAFGLAAGFVVARAQPVATMQTWPLAARAGVEATGTRPAQERKP